MISQIAAGKKEIRLGDLSPTRDFNYVADICQGYLNLANCTGAVGEVVNIGSNSEVSILDTLNLIKEIMGSEVCLICEEQRLRPQNSEVFRLCCDNSKIKTLAGYEPRHSLEEGLQKTIEWFVKPENLDKYKTGMYNI